MPSVTTTKDFSSYFNHAQTPYNYAPSSSSPTAHTPHSSDKFGLGFSENHLDMDQKATVAIQIEQDPQMPHLPSGGKAQKGKSASCFADPVSVSPAAMFLSAFSSPKPSQPPPDAEGFTISGYTFGPVLGYGAFSTIRQAFSTSGGVVAVKIIRRSDHFKQGEPSVVRNKIKREASVWATFCHEHILPLFSAHHTTYADYFFTLCCPAGSLFDILKRDGRPALPQDDAGMMFRQVVRGLRYLHEVMAYVHGDIKLENVLVDETGVCRIGDFGMTRKIGECYDDDDDEAVHEQTDDSFQKGHATVQRAVSLVTPGAKASGLREHLTRYRNSTSSTQPPPPARFPPGSLPYAAPELLIPQSEPPVAHPARDIWALGVLLYALLTGRLPFTDAFEPRLPMKIISGVYDIPANIGRGAERVLRGCLDSSDTSRWTIAMVDEVAWGIGWGPEGDDVTPAESDDEFQPCYIPSSSRSESRHPQEDIIEDVIPESQEWHREESRPRSSVEAASRRSSSRIKRSLSRAPVVVPSSRSPIVARSVSRPSRAASPSVCALTVNTTMSRSPSNPSTSSAVRTPSSSQSARFFGPNIMISQAPVERGRPRRKAYGRSASRSPSPSIAVPTTPIDSPHAAVLDMRGKGNTMDRSISRGRPTYSRSHRHLYSGHVADTESELDVLDETSDWGAAAAVASAMVPPHTAADPTSRFTLSHQFSSIKCGRDGISDPWAPIPADNVIAQSRVPRSMSKPSYGGGGTSVSRSPCVGVNDYDTPRRRPGSSPPVQQGQRWLPLPLTSRPPLLPTPTSGSSYSSSSGSSMLSERMRKFPANILTPVKPRVGVLTRSRSLDALRM